MNASVAIQVLPTVSSDQLLPVVDKVIEYIKSKGLKTFVSPFETTIEGDYDEFSGLLWGVDDAARYTTSFKFACGTGGASNVPSGTYFLYGDAAATPLSRAEAVTDHAAHPGRLFLRRHSLRYLL